MPSARGMAELARPGNRPLSATGWALHLSCTAPPDSPAGRLVAEAAAQVENALVAVGKGAGRGLSAAATPAGRRLSLALAQKAISHLAQAGQGEGTETRHGRSRDALNRRLWSRKQTQLIFHIYGHVTSPSLSGMVPRGTMPAVMFEETIARVGCECQQKNTKNR